MVVRCLTVWSTASTVALVVVRSSLHGLVLGGSFDDVVASLAAVALAVCAAWAWLVTTVVVVQALSRGAGPVRGVPTWARRAVLVACGLAVLAAVPAQAADGLGGLPLPDRPTGSAGAGTGDPPAPTPPPTSDAHPSVSGHGHVYVVRPGDSLWAITAAHLDPAAGVARIARATTALHHLNRDVVGSDPDVVHPGQRLRTPDRFAPRGEVTR